MLAFLIGPWKLTFGQSAFVLMSSGVGAIIGAYVWGWLADRVGRRVVFIGTVLNFSIATGLLYFTPDNGWIYLAFMRFFVGTGVGGLYCVDLPLVQEFMPSSKRGWVGGLVTCVIPLGVGLGPSWRPLSVVTNGGCCLRSAYCRRCWFSWSGSGFRRARAGSAAKVAMRMRASRWPGRFRWNRRRFRLPTATDAGPVITSNWFDLFKYPRSLLVFLAWQCRRPDRRLRHHAVGAVAVRAAVEGDAAGSRQDDDPA